MTVQVTVYSRSDCHLCEDAIRTIEAVADRIDTDLEVEEVDIDADEELQEAYGDRVPYVFIEDTPAFKYRVDADELASRLSRQRRRTP